MPSIEHFGETTSVVLRILVDNQTDVLAQSTGQVKYHDEPLRAEHGFAVLVDLPASDMRILWDSGATRYGLVENMRRMQIQPASIAQVALSHGHYDHTTGLTEMLRSMELAAKPKEWKPNDSLEEIRQYRQGRQVPIVVHPAAFRERWRVAADGTKYGPSSPPPQSEWQSLGGRLVVTEEPFELAPGCWTTGTIPRRSFESAGTAATRAFWNGTDFERDYVDDDQAIVMNLRGKGLVILAGCAHSGIVNTIHYAREISGVSEIWAVIGGFHLDSAGDEEIARTLEEIRGCKPHILVPMHCTGFKAMCQAARALPDAFILGLVGATFPF